MKLLNYKIGAGGQFTPNTTIFIAFEHKKAIKITGDNRVGKTTILDLLLMNLGAIAGDDFVKRLVNKDTNTIDTELEFVGNDKLKYKTRITKSQFILEYEGEKLPEPKEKTRQLLGAVGVNPMALKNASTQDVIKWLSGYTTKGTEQYQKEYEKLKEGIKQSRNTRADANKNYKAIKTAIDGDISEAAWSRNEERYGKAIDIKGLSVSLEAAGKKSDNYIKAETKLKEFKSRREQLMAELNELESKIEQAEDYLQKNKAAKNEYDTIKKQYESAAEKSAKYQWWLNVKNKKSEMDEYETLAQRADSKEKELLDELKVLQADLIPNLRGLEILLEDEYEDGKLARKSGLYYKGFHSTQLSESEFISVYIEILRRNKVKILIIDGINNLGSDVMEVLDKFKNEGAYILYSEMRRGQQTLEIELE
jgi:hypothetical protein